MTEQSATHHPFVNIGDYFTSPEAIILFQPNKNEKVVQCLVRRIELLGQAAMDDETLKLVSNTSDISTITNKGMTHLRMKFVYLQKAYELAIQYMNKKTWKECCELCIQSCEDNGTTYCRNTLSVMRWNREFRSKDTFENPFSKEVRQPKLFQFFPEAKTAIIRFCSEGVKNGSLSSESLRNEILTGIAPNCYKQLIDDAGNDASLMPSYKELLYNLDLTTICISTVWRWMIVLGYEYDENKKCYYTDGHERPDVVADRNDRFLLEYFRLEKCAHRWAQLKEVEAVYLENNSNNYPKHCYYSYISDEGISMREYHIDTHKALFAFVSDSTSHFGGNLSVRIDGRRPVLLVGQDESTFHQYTFSKKSWKGPNGSNFLIPKSEGDIYMVSGYQAREFGLGLGSKLTPTIIGQINNARRNTNYISAEDAILINGNATKKDLKDDPTLRFFHAGVSNEGYWNSSHAKIQLEDVTDCLKMIYPAFDVAHLYDQSAGHTKIRGDGLSINSMNVSPGGAVPKMRSTIIPEVGNYNGDFKVGDEQNLSFQDSDPGPFWLSDQDKIDTKFDTEEGPIFKKEISKSELLIELRKIGVDTTKKRFLKPELITICIEKGIAISKELRKIKEGWCKKPKGMLQVLYERGFIDPTKVINPRSMSYTKKGRKSQTDTDGNLSEIGKETSLHHLLSKCTDFLNEKSDLEHLCSDLSTDTNTITITFTPKFHCEIAGEGIEYAWGLAKKYYRRIPYREKRSFTQFVVSVKLSLSKVSLDMSRRFSQKARSYMLGYHHQRKEKDSEVRVKVESSYDYNEKIHKLYKSHRDISTTDFVFISEVIKECII